MNARLPTSLTPSDASAIASHVNTSWQENILPELVRYIEVPAKSPAFDPDWAQHGLLDRVLQSAADW
ncbi:MAG TPA: peptidase M20, partial [Hydrogenophaga sp.]